jgi:anthranilate phosphoribosyltransferase
MKEYLERVIAGDHLSQQDMESAFDIIMSGDATSVQIAGFLIALRMKGETSEELAGGALSMRKHAVQIDVGNLNVVDTCGTGGDNSNTFNISTTAGFVAAGAGVPIAKHGNRSVSSKCGSADVLMELGVNLEVEPEVVERCIKEAGLGFMFAPKMHPAMKYAMPARKELGVRTMFNMLGPLTNPAAPPYQLIGAWSPEAAKLMADALAGMPIERAFVVHGAPGWDEATPVGEFVLYDVRPGSVEETTRAPEDYGLGRCTPEELAGGDAEHNANELKRVFSCEDKGAHRDALLMGTSLVLEVQGTASDAKQGVEMAAAALDDGRAMTLLEQLRTHFKN